MITIDKNRAIYLGKSLLLYGILGLTALVAFMILLLNILKIPSGEQGISWIYDTYNITYLVNLLLFPFILL